MRSWTMNCTHTREPETEVPTMDLPKKAFFAPYISLHCLLHLQRGPGSRRPVG